MPRRLSLATGAALGAAGTVLGILLAVTISGGRGYVISLAASLLSWALLLIGPHCLSHYIVGAVLGVRFSHYVLAPSGAIRVLPAWMGTWVRRAPILGIRVNWRASKNASGKRLAAMFASGTIISMAAPSIVVTKAYLEGLADLAGLLGLLTLANIVFTLIYSPRVGDLRRARDSWGRALVRNQY